MKDLINADVTSYDHPAKLYVERAGLWRRRRTRKLLPAVWRRCHCSCKSRIAYFIDFTYKTSYRTVNWSLNISESLKTRYHIQILRLRTGWYCSRHRRSPLNDCALHRQRAGVRSRTHRIVYSCYPSIAILLLECLKLARLRSEALSARSASEVNAALVRTPRPRLLRGTSNHRRRRRRPRASTTSVQPPRGPTHGSSYR